MLQFYTDGSFRSSENMGGYGIIGFNENLEIIYAKQEQFSNVTNNQMELTAILKLCELIEENNIQDDIIIYSDSSYCVNAINDWMYKWKSNNWINSRNEPVKNLSLIQTLYNYFTSNFFTCQVKVVHLRGHEDNIGNELADALATHNINKFVDIVHINNIKINSLIL